MKRDVPVLGWKGRDDAKWKKICAKSKCQIRKLSTIRLTETLMKVWDCIVCGQRIIIIVNLITSTDLEPAPPTDSDAAS